MRHIIYISIFIGCVCISNQYVKAAAMTEERQEEGGGAMAGKAVLSKEIQEGYEKREPWALIDAANEIMSSSDDYAEGARLYYEAGIAGDDSIRYTVEALVRGFSSMKKEDAIDAIKEKLSEHYSKIKSK